MNASTLIIELIKLMAETNDDPEVKMSPHGTTAYGTSMIFSMKGKRLENSPPVVVIAAACDIAYNGECYDVVKIFDDWEEKE